MEKTEEEEEQEMEAMRMELENEQKMAEEAEMITKELEKRLHIVYLLYLRAICILGHLSLKRFLIIYKSNLSAMCH